MKIPQNTTPDDSENPFKADGANSHFENENEVNETPFPIRNIPLTTKLRSNHGRQKWISKIEFASRLSFFSIRKGRGPEWPDQLNKGRYGDVFTRYPQTVCFFTFCETLFTRCRKGIVPADNGPGISRLFARFLSFSVGCRVRIHFHFDTVAVRQFVLIFKIGPFLSFEFGNGSICSLLFIAVFY